MFLALAEILGQGCQLLFFFFSFWFSPRATGILRLFPSSPTWRKRGRRGESQDRDESYQNLKIIWNLGVRAVRSADLLWRWPTAACWRWNASFLCVSFAAETLSLCGQKVFILRAAAARGGLGRSWTGWNGSLCCESWSNNSVFRRLSQEQLLLKEPRTAGHLCLLWKG